MKGLAPLCLSDGLVTLRDVEIEDLADLYRWRADPRSRPMFRTPEMPTFEAHERFVRRYLEAPGRDRWFVIEAGGVPVGTIALYDFDAAGTSCEWGRMVIDPDHRRSGYARRALDLLVSYSRHIGLTDLHCLVLGTNVPALRLYTSVGFREGREERIGDRTFVHMTLDLDAERP